MWKFNPFGQKETAGLEGRAIDVGNIKIHVRNAVAEGGFSCVYLARDALNASKQYALKHMICNDGESLDLVMKEIQVMNLLKGHPNIVNLVAHTILDMGRTKEALLVMEFCEKSLVTVLQNRGAGYFEEKQVLLIFRDVCNAVFAMHLQSPPIAHRDLKAENVLLGSDGVWKLCDFGSTTTNHKCFDKAEEMGIEEDNIRKHTTPAYRAPEMWDLYRKEVISEKVDIWALGCLLYRICYLKSAFDGESKLQILNGNYRIPELPKYGAATTKLIKDMLEASPGARPDITQVWFRVNEQLPVEMRKNLPDGPVSAVNLRPYTAKHDEGAANKSNQTTLRIRPPRSSSEPILNISPRSQVSQKTGGGVAAPVGAFWSTHHAQDNNTAIHGNKESIQQSCQRTPSSNLTQTPQTEGKTSTGNESNTFVADFDASGLNSGNTNRSTSGKEQTDVDINSLKEQLKQANSEKAEITMKCEKLTAICRSQQQEIQVLKLALAEATPSSQNSKDNLSSQISPCTAKATPSSQNSKDRSRGLNSPGNTVAILPPQPTKDITKSQISPVSTPSINPPREKIEKGIWELEQAMLASSFASASPAPNQWQAFDEEPKVQTVSSSLVLPANNGQQNSTMPAAAGPPPTNSWAFGQNGVVLSTPADHQAGNTYQRYGNSEARRVETSQTTGWVGF